MKTILSVLGFVALALGIAWFVVTARAVSERELFRRDFLESAPDERRALFARHHDSLDAQAMLAVLEEAYLFCHSEAHDLGKVIFAREGDLISSIQQCGNSCTGGCFHGVLMEAFAPAAAEPDSHIELADVRPKLKDFCKNPAITALYREGKCAHGVGHALLYLSDYHLDGALNACKDFGDKRVEFYCTGGVFMEYDGVYGESDFASKPPLYPCDTYTEFPSSCYLYKAQRLLKKLGSARALAEECMKLSAFEELGCFRGYGISFMRELQENPAKLGGICSKGTNDDQRMCIDGAIERFADFGEELPSRACESVPDPTLKQACFDAVQRKAYSMDKDFSLYFR